MALFTWTGLPARLQEMIAKARALDLARVVLGLPVSLPEGASLWAAIAELIAASRSGEINVKAFGAKGDGAADDTTAVQVAYAAAIAIANLSGLGVKVVFPQGSYSVTDTITINTHRIHTEGAGIHASKIVFNPSSAKPLFLVQNSNPASIIFQGSIKNLGFVGAGTQQKILFDLWDTSEWLIENTAALTWTGNSGSTSTPSIALRTNGREVLAVRRNHWSADRPIHIRVNPNNAGAEATDHFHFTDLYISTLISSEAGILIDANAVVSNLTFDGYQAWVGGKYGLDYTSGGTSGVASFHAAFYNVRYEQSADATGYAFRWQPQTCQNLLLLNCNWGSAGNGLYVRNTRRVTIESTQFAGGSGKIACDIDDTSDEVWFLNTFFQDLSTVNVGTMVEVFSVGKRNANSAIAPTAYYASSTTIRKAIKVDGNYMRTYSQSLANGGASFTMPDFSPGNGAKVCIVQVAGYSGTGPIIEGGVVIDSPTVAALVSGTANFAATNTAGKLCFLHAANPTIINNTAQTLNVLVTVTWMP